MLTLALLLLAQPALREDGVLLNTASSDVFIYTGIRPADDITFRQGEQIAFYDAAADNLTLEYGYDCVDIARVMAGLPATKDESVCCSDRSECCGSVDVGSCDPPATFLGFADEPPEDMSVWWVPPLFGAVYAFPLFSLGAWNALWALAAAILAFNLFWRSGARRMSEPPPPPDGLVDSLMTTVFGRSWRTGISGFAGVALTVAAAAATIEPPFTFAKLAPLLPGLVASLGLMAAKDGKVSHTQLPPK